MAFRKRNVAVTQTPPKSDSKPAGGATFSPSGVRPSLLTSHAVTSTGASSLDALLGGHGGLALGSSLLIEESGTTDFAGALLRYFAAEGLCHGHMVHVVGVSDGWVRELPGVTEERKPKVADEQEKMKIAWRYEKRGQAGERALPDRGTPTSPQESNKRPEIPFCHTFDLSKRLSLPHGSHINIIQATPNPSPFEKILKSITSAFDKSPSEMIHRIVIPTILSPAVYHPGASSPQSFLRFLHSLRSFLCQNSTRATAVITLPLELFSRSSALIRTAETLTDGVLELTPFPHLMDASNALAESGGARANEEQPQGLVRIHKLPLTTERGEGGAGAGNTMGEDLAFTISRRKFVIKPFSLPPLEGDQEAQKEAGKLTGKDVEF